MCCVWFTCFCRLFTQLLPLLKKLKCLEKYLKKCPFHKETVESNDDKRIRSKFCIQIILTLFLTQILNCAFDEFIFVGLSQLLEWNTEAEDKQIVNTQTTGDIHLNQLVPGSQIIEGLSDAKSFAKSMFPVCFGFLLSIYINLLVFSTWRFIYNENRNKSFLDMSNVYVNGFLMASVIINLILAVCFFMMSMRSYNEYQTQRSKFENFSNLINTFNSKQTTGMSYSFGLSGFKDLFHINNKGKDIGFKSNENQLLIRESITRLENFYYMQYSHLRLSSMSMVIIVSLTCFFIVLEVV